MMKIIVGQKQINLSRLIIFAWSAIGLASCTNIPWALVSEPQPGNSGRITFADWCLTRANLIPEAKHTVDVLLEKAETNDCDAADRKLSSLTELYINNDQISDIKPLASLTNLTQLALAFNEIGDIKPLVSLTNLT
ncbi:leucine-rich repeat domain-containing protein, partial [Microcoleus anatoxicus PTRS2]